jgi:hypothetical protein
MSGTGLFTAGLPAGGPYTVTASGGGESGTAAVSVLNVAPVADNKSVTTTEDTGETVALTASDDNGDSLTFSVVTGPAHGTLSGSGASRTYTPSADYNGPDSFTYRANDGAANSNTATVSISVTAVNDAPTADAQSVTATEDTAQAITLTGDDVDGDAITYHIGTGPTHGSISGSGASRTYTPDPDYSGPDSFTFRTKDASVYSGYATVSITVTAQNDDPEISSYSPETPFSMDAGSSQVFQVWATDGDGDALTYSWKIDGTGVGESDADLNYSPTEADAGGHAIAVTVSDGKGGEATHSWSVTVNSVTPDPTIALSLTSLSTSCAAGGNPSNQTFKVWNSGGGTLDYSVADNQTWMSVGPTSGSSTGEKDTITVSYSASSLSAGVYSGKITVTDSDATNSPRELSVTLTVTAAPVDPEIDLSTGSMSASCTAGGNASDQSFAVSNSGGGTLSYTITDNQDWLSCSPASGTSTGEPDTITVSFATSGLAAGTYNATITVSDSNASNNPRTIAVALTVNSDGDGGGGGGGGGGGCSLGAAADPAGWMLPYLGLALAWLLGRRRKR